ncbi:hypothetical protein Dimus_028926 [Dionaea muscipula]
MEGESSEAQGWCNRFEDVHVDPNHIDDSESILNEVDLEDIRAAFRIPDQYSYSLPERDEPCIATPLPSTIAIHFERVGAEPSVEVFYSLCCLKEISGTGYWRFNFRKHMQIVELQSNVKAWKVKYVNVTSDEWDFGEEISVVLKEPNPKPRAVLNEIEMSLRSTFERFWTGGAPLWFQVISLRTLEENGIATLTHPRIEQMMARLWVMYGSTGSDILEETEAHRRSSDQ